MLHLERSHDMALVRSIMAHPKVYPNISDDGCKPREEWQPVDHESVHYLVVTDEDVPLGLFACIPQNFVCWEVHTCMLPRAWGAKAARAALVLLEYLWAETNCKRLITNVPADNRLALRYAERAGLKAYGYNQASYQKGGKLVDQVLLGISRP